MVNVSLKILVASSGLTMVGKSFSNQITLVSFLTVSFHSVCGEKAGKHTHTHAAQQSAEEMKKNSSNANNSKTLSCFFQRASSHIDMYYFNDE